MSNEPRKLFWFLGPADRETMTCGIVAWLLDPRGTHGLEEKFLAKICEKMVLPVFDHQSVTVKTEERQKGRRFDITLSGSKGEKVIIEVKCKSFGTREQLSDSDTQSHKLVRVGFDEWNWDDLTVDDKARWPLLRFQDISEILADLLENRRLPFYEFLLEFSVSLRQESQYFEELRRFFFDEDASRLPAPLTTIQQSDRFYNQLYWYWFKEKLRISGVDMDDLGESRSELSGVWYSFPSKKISHNSVEFQKLQLTLPVNLHCFIHIELTGSLLKKTEKPIGSIGIRIAPSKGGSPIINEEITTIAEALKLAEPRLNDVGYKIRINRPTPGGYFTPLKRKLHLGELRFTELQKLITQLE